MKKCLLCFMVMTAVTMFYGCQQQNLNECRIHGTVADEKFEGKRIFLVPFMVLRSRRLLIVLRSRTGSLNLGQTLPRCTNF